MPWPACRRCSCPVDVYDHASDVRPAETEVYRSYRCHCGWEALTVERVYCEEPETLALRRKWPVARLVVVCQGVVDGEKVGKPG